MEKIINNKYNIEENNIDELVKRVKILLINSKNEILLGYSHKTYQFIGGHVEENELLVETVNREIKEETGMELNITNIEPFAVYEAYYKDYPKKGMNRKNEIYYFEYKTDNEINLENTKYTLDELDGNFKLEYISLDKVEEVIISNSKKYGDIKGITTEMLNILKIYKNK